MIAAAFGLYFLMTAALRSFSEALACAGIYITPEMPHSSVLTNSDIPVSGIYESDNLPNIEMLDIVSTDLSRQNGQNTLLLSNETEYQPDLDMLAESELSSHAAVMQISGNTDTYRPIVLVLHTHGTESFTEENVSAYPSDYTAERSQDITKNVVAVGSVITDVLRLNGIPTEHCEIMHDAESYYHSYERSCESIQEYLKRYPSIKYIFDVHRDAIVSASGAMVKPTVEISEEKAAQLMFVCGSDFKGADHPHWQNNLAFAAKLQRSLNGKYKNIARPINLRGASFNEQYTDCSLLVEIGSAASTLTETKRTAVIFAQEVAEYILERD